MSELTEIEEGKEIIVNCDCGITHTITMDEENNLSLKSKKRVNANEEDNKGKNEESLDKEGFNKDGFNKDGFNKEGFNKSGFDKDGFNKGGFNKQGRDRKGRRKSILFSK